MEGVMVAEEAEDDVDGRDNSLVHLVNIRSRQQT